MTDQRRGPPPLPTRVAHAEWDEHWFFGRRVFAELMGAPLWDLLAIAGGGEALRPDQRQLLDELAGCLTLADPRIFPVKLTRLLAAHGGAVEALFGSYLLLAGDWLGPRAILGAYDALRRLAEKLAAAGGPAEEARLLADELRRGERWPGFGVPFRRRDERVVALSRRLAEQGLDQGRHWRLAQTLDEHFGRTKAVRLNTAGAAAAVCLDLDFSREQLYGAALAFSFPCFLANAVEGAAQSPAQLQRLDPAFVEYVGPARRRSPRALLADAGPGPDAGPQRPTS